MTSEQLLHIMPDSKTIDTYLPVLNAQCLFWKLDTDLKIAAFLATIAEESEEMNVITENLNYSAANLLATFPKHFATLADAQKVARKPELIANIVYASRMGNGDVASGDGWKYKGRGAIQLTGKSIYTDYGSAIGFKEKVVDNPDMILDPFHVINSALWFWWSRGLNKYSGDIQQVTRIVNGGLNGLAEREKYYAKAKEAFNLS